MLASVRVSAYTNFLNTRRACVGMGITLMYSEHMARVYTRVWACMCARVLACLRNLLASH